MTQPLRLDGYVGHLIRRAEQVHTALWTAQVSREVTSQQFAVLNALALEPDMDQRTLGAAASLDRSTITAIVRRLAEQGHVLQVRDDVDRRRNVLRLTDQGSRLLDSLIPTAQAINDQLLDLIANADREPTLRALRAVAYSSSPQPG
jgi:DNA-binding MarR family transcriptional regulator